MPRRCTVCAHPEREAIDRALLPYELTLRDIARRHGLSKDAAHRHQRQHLPAELVKVRQAEEAARGDRLLNKILSLRDRARVILDKAEAAGRIGSCFSEPRGLGLWTDRGVAAGGL